MKKTNVLILTAGRIPTDMASVFGDIPSGMIPINGKPAISWIIDKLASQGFANFFINIGYRKKLVEDFIIRKYTKKYLIKFINVDYHLGPGNSIINALSYIDSDDILIFLGDTIITENLNLDESFVYTSTDFDDPGKWCMIISDEKGNLKQLFDKNDQLENTIGLQAIVGVYYLKNIELLRTISKEINGYKKIEISEILNRYKNFENIKCIECKKWFDIGHLNRYHQSKAQLIQSRYFNKFEFNSLAGTITKKSSNKEKLIKEIQWYLNVPKDISVLTPRVISYDIGNDPFLELEYYGYPTLSDLFVYGDLHSNIWRQIIDKLINILNIFSRHKKVVHYDAYRSMYLTKTIKRLEELIDNDKDFKKIFSYEKILVNNEPLLNFNILIPFIQKEIDYLYHNSNVNNSIVHGDFCLSNIMYDINGGIIRMIDPRGTWNGNFYGDIRYDVAKLRHSIAEKYDFIVNDLFMVKCNENSFELSIFSTQLHDKVKYILDELISKTWNIDDIKFIEGLLFISMIPLHNDNKSRQIAMYCIGLKLLNDIYRKNEI